MKIAPKAIEAYISKPDLAHRAILLYGPDSGLVRQRTGKLTRGFLGEKFDPFALVELTEAKLLADPALLADELGAISMMAPKRVIVIQASGDKLTKIIEGAVDSFNNDVLVLIAAEELNARSSLRAWAEKAPQAASIACYHDEVRDVQDVLRKSFEAAGIKLHAGVMEHLSQQLGNDRYVTLQEIEKLITYAAESKELKLLDVQLLVDYNRETSFDEMVNAVADRNVAQLEKTLTLLLREGTSPVAYIRALLRYFNRLYYIKSRMEEGESADQVIQSLRPPVFFRQAPILTRHAQHWSSEGVVKALRLLINAELACKTSDLPIVPASSRKLLQVTQAR